MASERDSEGLPAPLDRTTLERVLARAAELQSGEQGGMGQDPTELLTEKQLIEIGREVGLSEAHIKQALAEEKTRINLAEEEGVSSRFTGPGIAVATRLIRGSATDLMPAINAWMQHEECLRVQRQFSDRMIWEPRSDLLGNIRVGLGLGGRDYALARATSVGATVIQIEPGKTLVRLEADVTRGRKARVRSGTVVAGAGIAGGSLMGVAAAMVAGALFPVALAVGAIPAAIGSAVGYGIARGHRQVVTRTQLALEQILDRLEHNIIPRPRGVLEQLAFGRPLLR